jgi:mannonate dehydratase
MELALILPPERDERWDYARQMGVEKAVVHTLEIGDGRRHWSSDELADLVDRFESEGLDVAVMEGGVPVTDEIRLGGPNQDRDIERFKQFLRDAGSLGIPVVCYDWMPGVRWARTRTDLPARGGSLTTEFDIDDVADDPPADVAPVSAAELWENLEYFLEEVVPVAEAADVRLGLHPDDPPISELLGIDRIITSVEAYERVLDIHPSEYNGVTFCQGNFAAMGVDIPEAIRRLGDRIQFVHFRDVRGSAEKFVETWHDEGPTDMLEAIRAYRKVGFDGPMRPDHVSTMAGETNDNPGYETKGRLFAIGYMKGLLEQVDGTR